MLLYTALPMVWMLLTSIKSGFAAMQFPPQWWPTEPTLASYQKLLDPQNSVGQDFLRFFWNSLFVSTATTILAVVVAVPAAYAFSRFRFPGRKFLFFSVLLRNMFPAVIFLVPLFILMRLLGLVNTHGSLILTYLTFGLPLAIWLLKGFYDNIPIQLEQAARIDGATRFQAFLLIVMPLSAPGIIATAIYSFIGAWNEYIYAYTFLTKNDQLTLPVGIQRFFSENTTDFPGPDGGELHDERAGRGAVPRPAEIFRARPHRRRGQTLEGCPMAQVVLKDLVKTYGAVYAVNDVSLTVNDGEFVALVGPSGCGKTTTLNLVAGLIPITVGDIIIGDRVVNDLDPKDRDIAMVFQNYALYPQKTVYKNLAFPLQMRKLPKDEIDQKVQEAAQGARHDAPARAQAARALRRPAAARGARPRAGARPGGVPDGRAALQPRRQAARADALARSSASTRTSRRPSST